MNYTPHREAEDAEHYSRLFPPSPSRPAPDTPAQVEYADALRELVATMKDEGQRICPDQTEIPINAGHTYFGQFLAHDLTEERADTFAAWKLAPHELKNYRTSRIDLDHLYGDGPEGSDNALFEADGARLKVGDLIESSLRGRGPRRRSFDLKVESGKLVASDERNRDNIILRQMTAVFARLHNCAVEQFRRAGLRDAALFQRARLQTTWQFQRFVVHDYLPRVLDAGVYATVFVNQRPKVRWKRFTVPIEFSAAAMRFGHSMVRDDYFLSNAVEVKLKQILERARDQTPLEAKWEIDWGGFFQSASASATISARPIDTQITRAMFDIEVPVAGLYDRARSLNSESARGDRVPLPFVSLWRGAALALSSGQAAAEAFGFPSLTEAELCNDSDGKVTPQGRVLRERGLASETPLFFYLLKEAEVRNHANLLGPTGSQIIAETIHAALAADPDSFINHADGDEPLEWEISGRRQRIDSIAHLFALAPEL